MRLLARHALLAAAVAGAAVSAASEPNPRASEPGYPSKPMLFGGLPQALSHVQGGRLRAVAVTTLSRSPVVPDVPTVAEFGTKIRAEIAQWAQVVKRAGIRPE